MSDNHIQLYEDQPIRTAWDEEAEEWYFSVVDVVGVLTDQPDARRASTYWAVLKKRLKNEGADQLLTNCKQLKMTAADGKKRMTDEWHPLKIPLRKQGKTAVEIALSTAFFQLPHQGPGQARGGA